MRRLMLFLFACGWAVLNPWMADTPGAEAAVGTGSSSAGSWPALWEGRPLTPLPLTPVERKFSADFSGALARFSDGSREILFRRVTRPTRKLHPSADCLRASGYVIHPLPAETGSAGGTWSRFRADGKEISLIVEEMILDKDGRSWSDVSAWYWHAVLGKTRGPWLAVTKSRRTVP